MIKSLRIENFQSHKDSSIEFAGHVTAIIGHNNNGKSAIFRALVKILRNEPKGALFIMDTPVKEKECKITLFTEKGKVVRQIRNDSSSESNIYQINDTDIFAKFGNETPLEVQEVFGISPIQQFGDLKIDLNFQHQLDDKFLVTGRGVASIRGKVLGKTTGVDEVQRALQLATSEKKKLMQNKERLEGELTELNESLTNYDYLNDSLQKLVALKDSQEECNFLDLKINSIQEIYSNLKDCVKDAKDTRQKLSALENLDVVFTIFPTIDELHTKIGLLQSSIDIKVAIAQKEYIIQKYSNIDLSGIDVLGSKIQLLGNLHEIQSQIEICEINAVLNIPNFTEIESKENYYSVLKDLYVQFKGIRDDAVDLNTQIKKYDEELLKLKIEIEDCHIKIKELGIDPAYLLTEEELVICNEFIVKEGITQDPVASRWFEEGFKYGRAYSNFVQSLKIERF